MAVSLDDDDAPQERRCTENTPSATAKSPPTYSRTSLPLSLSSLYPYRGTNSCRRLYDRQLALLLKTLVSALRSYATGFAFTAVPPLLGLWLRTLTALVSPRRGHRRTPFVSTTLQILKRSTRTRPGLFLGILTGVFTLLNGAFELIGAPRSRLVYARSAAKILRSKDNRPHDLEIMHSPDDPVPDSEMPVDIAEDRAKEQNFGSFIKENGPTFLAGAIAGGGALLVLENRLDVAMIAAVRAVDLLVQTAYKKGKLGWIPNWAVRQSNALLFATSCAEIIFCWMFHPQALPKSYVKWIFSMGEIDPLMIRVMQAGRRGEFYSLFTGYPPLPGSSSPDMVAKREFARTLLAPYCERIGVPPSLGDPAFGKIPCMVVHGGRDIGCEAHAVIQWLIAFRKALKLYIPVHLVPVLLFRFRRLLDKKSAVPALVRVITEAGKSASFLATFVSSLYYTVCIIRTRLGDPLNLPLDFREGTALSPALGAFVGGFLSIQLESQRRGGEIMLYCAPRALYAIWWRLKRALGVKSGLPFGEVGVFALSMGVLMTAMKQRDRTAVRSSTSGFLGWLLMEKSS